MLLNRLQVVDIEIPVVHPVLPRKTIIALLSIPVGRPVAPSQLIARTRLAIIKPMNVTHRLCMFSNKYRIYFIVTSTDRFLLLNQPELNS